MSGREAELDLPGALGSESPETPPDERDLHAQDPLLGVPTASLLQPRALRGMAFVAVAVTMVVWPTPTDRVLGLLLGVGLAGYVVTAIVELRRDRAARTFVHVVGVSVAAGFAAALVTEPQESLRSVTQACGVAMAMAALVSLGQLVARRQALGWGTSKSVGLGGGGVLLIAYPEPLLQAAIAIVAVVVGADGLVQVFSEPPDDDEADGPAGAFALWTWVRRRPTLAEDRQLLQEKVFYEGSSAPVRFARFTALMGFASVIASIGVVVESTAVVIGAMLVAPLMVPLMGTALSLTMGWPKRTLRCSAIALAGVGIAVGVGVVIGAVAPRLIDPTTNTEIISRTSPTTLDLAIAVAAGAAGAYALSRRDVSDSLPGVAVAIALVPPLTVVGLTWQDGDWSSGNGALLLFLTNATAILLAGGLTFVLIGVAPLRRVSESQQRLKSVIVALLSATALVVVLLALNGISITQTELARADVEAVMADWTARHEDFRVVDVRTTSSGTTVVDLAGPGEPPDLDDLLADLDDAVRGDSEVRVTWVDQQQASVNDEP